MAIECAMIFDETEDVRTLFDALKSVIGARQKTFNLEIESRKS
jgi:hypothetical protein